MTNTVHRDWLARNLAAPSRVGPSVLREEDAVLACAVGCDLAGIAPFVRSLRAVFPGQVILVVDRKPTLLAWLSTHGVETVIAADRAPHRKPHAMVARFAVYAQLLQERPEIRNVILAEVRDVVFQGDPFADPPADLHLFEGGASAAGLNARVLQALIGEGLARDLGQRPPVSPGVVAGPSAAVVRFCRAMLLLCDMPGSSLGGGIDQAACHVIAHLRLVGGDVRPNFERAVVASSGLRVKDGRILNPDDSFSPVIVGYGRSRELSAHVRARWGLPAARRPRRRVDLRRTMRTLQASFLGALPQLR